MRSSLRVTTAVLAATLTLAAPAAQAAAASDAGRHSVTAKPTKAPKGKGVKGGRAATVAQRQLLQDIARASAALDRALSPSRIAVLSEASQASLLLNADVDRAALDGYSQVAEANDGSADLRQVRRDLKAFRTVNYVIVVNVLREAEALVAGGSGDAAALGAVILEARGVSAATPKADLATLQLALETAAGAVVEEPVAP